MEFFQIVDDRAVAVPNETGLILGPVGVTLGSHAVVRVIERSAAFPVGAEHLAKAAIRPALGAPGNFESGVGAWVPERACGRDGPVVRKVELNKVAILSVWPRSRRHPKNARRPRWLLRQDVRACQAPMSLQGARAEFGRCEVSLEQTLIGFIHPSPLRRDLLHQVEANRACRRRNQFAQMLAGTRLLVRLADAQDVFRSGSAVQLEFLSRPLGNDGDSRRRGKAVALGLAVEVDLDGDP